MKKIIIFVLSMFFIGTKAFAACDYSRFCTNKPYDLKSKGTQIASKYTGMTFLSEQIAQGIIKKELKKATKEGFKVRLKAYSLADLAGGRFQSLKISGKNLEIDGAYITSFEAKSVCPFNYVELGKNSLKFKENFVMDYTMEISNTDLRKTMKSTGYLDMLNKTNISAMGITFFKLSDADVQLKNNKLYFTINVTTPMSAKPITMLVRSDIKVEDGNIVLTKVDFVNLFTVIDLSKVTYLLNALNPLTFSTDILENKDAKMRIGQVDIIGDKIIIKGCVFIPKNVAKK